MSSVTELVEFTLKPVGVVHSSIQRPEDMPKEGATARLEVFSEYREALDGIDEYSHIIVLLFCHKAERSMLEVRPMRGVLDLPKKGVFATRSPARPNPVAFCVTRVLSRDESIVTVDALDAIDGTPIVDIKPYLPAWDCVFSAKTGNRAEILQKLPRKEILLSMMKEASNFHGDKCVGVAIGVRMVYKAFEVLKCDPRNRDLKIISSVKACIADGVQGLTGATNKRFRIKDPIDRSLTFEINGRVLRIMISEKKLRQVDEVLSASDNEVFARVEES
jgi:tRNA-Thr(GGU) m(6)t(6)A37 methyltransferase TsaA